MQTEHYLSEKLFLLLITKVKNGSQHKSAC